MAPLAAATARHGQNSSSQPAAAPVGASSSSLPRPIPPIPECASHPHRYSIKELEAAKNQLGTIIEQNKSQSNNSAQWNLVSAKYVHAHGWIAWHIDHKNTVALAKFVAGRQGQNSSSQPAAAPVGASSSSLPRPIPPIPECASHPHRYSIKELEAAKNQLGTIIEQNKSQSNNSAQWNLVSAKYVHAHGWIAWHLNHKVEKFVAGLDKKGKDKTQAIRK